jgi:FkbM family methyltransferase
MPYHFSMTTVSVLETRPTTGSACEGEFGRRLTTALLTGCSNYQTNNADYWRFPMKRLDKVKRQARAKVLAWVRRRNFIRVDTPPGISTRLDWVMDNFADLERSYIRFADGYSRDLFIELLCFRVLGPERVKLTRNNDDFWKKRQLAQSRCIQSHSATVDGWRLHHYRIDEASSLHGHAMNVLHTFFLEQYAFRHGAIEIAAGPGDVILDGGACWGDTTLYFARKTGERGKVFAFEFVPDNLALLQRNMEENTCCAGPVEVARLALWDRSGEKLWFDPSGPGTRLDTGKFSVDSVSIDDFARSRDVRVDFIKLDIEGAELKALMGAEQTLRKYKPKLAVALYHKPEDLFTIADYVEGLGLGYRFFLDHFTIHQEETVLFAQTQPN